MSDCYQRARVKLESLVDICRINIGFQLSTSTPRVLRVERESLTEDYILIIDTLSSESAAGISNRNFILLSTTIHLFSNRV